jgi:hypothetical protein
MFTNTRRGEHQYVGSSQESPIGSTVKDSFEKLRDPGSLCMKIQVNDHPLGLSHNSTHPTDFYIIFIKTSNATDM